MGMEVISTSYRDQTYEKMLGENFSSVMKIMRYSQVLSNVAQNEVDGEKMFPNFSANDGGDKLELIAHCHFKVSFNTIDCRKDFHHFPTNRGIGSIFNSVKPLSIFQSFCFQVHQRMVDNQIPQDTQWNDIDYMNSHLDFTIDPNNFGDLPAFAEKLRSSGMHYILMAVRSEL